MIPMTKKEYIKKYNSEHPKIYFLITIQIFLDVVGWILAFPNFIQLVTKSDISLYFGSLTGSLGEITTKIYLGVAFMMASLIPMIMRARMQSQAGKEYEVYVAEFYRNNKKDSKFEVDSNTFSFWTCPKCNTDNSGGYCEVCGTKKPEVKSAIPYNDNLGTGSYWFCPQCGRRNMNYVGTCGCGQQKPR